MADSKSGDRLHAHQQSNRGGKPAQSKSKSRQQQQQQQQQQKQQKQVITAPPAVDRSTPALLVKTPTHEYYGFVIYLVSFVFYGVFLCWAYLPKQALIYLGFEYYPDKQWALRVPAWSIMAIIYILITSIGYQLMTALPLNSIRTLADKMSNINSSLMRRNQHGESQQLSPHQLQQQHGLRFGERAMLMKDVDLTDLGDQEDTIRQDTILPIHDLPIDLVNHCLFDSD